MFGVNLRADPSRDPRRSDFQSQSDPVEDPPLGNLITQHLNSLNKNEYGAMVLQIIKHYQKYIKIVPKIVGTF